MAEPDNALKLASRLIDSLYTEAIILAGEARAYFDEPGQAESNSLSPVLRVGFSCEALKVTTRLMHVVAWLLNKRAEDAGELSPGELSHGSRRLGAAAASDPAVTSHLPAMARGLIESSCDLYDRVRRLDRGPALDAEANSPAHSLFQRLERHWG